METKTIKVAKQGMDIGRSSQLQLRTLSQTLETLKGRTEVPAETAEVCSDKISRLAIPNIMAIITQCNERIKKLDGQASKANAKIAKKGKEKAEYEGAAKRIGEQYSMCLDSISELEGKIALQDAELSALGQKMVQLESATAKIMEIQGAIREKMSPKDAEMQIIVSAFEKGMSGAKELDKNLASLEAEAEKTKKEIRARTSQKEELVETRDFEKTRAKQFEIEIDDKLKAASKIAIEIGGLENENREREEMKRLENANISLLVRKSGIKSLYEDLKKASSERKQLEASAHEIANLRDLLEKARDTIEGANAQMHDTTEANLNLKTANDALAADVMSHREKLKRAGALDDKNAELVRTINRVRVALEKASDEVNRLTKADSEKGKEIARLTAELGSSVTDILSSPHVKRLDGEIRDLKSAKQDLENEVTGSRSRIAELEATVETLKDQLSSQVKSAPADKAAIDPTDALERQTAEELSNKNAEIRRELELVENALKRFLNDLESLGGLFMKKGVTAAIEKFQNECKGIKHPRKTENQETAEESEEITAQ